MRCFHPSGPRESTSSHALGFSRSSPNLMNLLSLYDSPTLTQTCAPQGGTGHCAPGASQVCPCRAAGNCEFVVGEMASRPLCMNCPCLFVQCPGATAGAVINLFTFFKRFTVLRPEQFYFKFTPRRFYDTSAPSAPVRRFCTPLPTWPRPRASCRARAKSGRRPQLRMNLAFAK